jgi:Protein of unknown function (DUF2924)
MDQQTQDAAAIEAGIGQVRCLGIEALRRRWRSMFGAAPPKGLTKDIIARMIAYRIQCEALGDLDRATGKLLDRFARCGNPQGLNRRLKAGTVLVREYQGQRHTVTVVPGGYLWQEGAYLSLSAIARAITGTAWNGPRFFGLRGPGDPEARAAPPASRPKVAQSMMRELGAIQTEQREIAAQIGPEFEQAWSLWPVIENLPEAGKFRVAMFKLIRACEPEPSKDPAYR